MNAAVEEFIGGDGKVMLLGQTDHRAGEQLRLGGAAVDAILPHGGGGVGGEGGQNIQIFQQVILMNIDDEPAGTTVDLSAYADWKLAASLSATGEPVEMDGTNLKMPAYGIAVLVPNN